MGTTTFNMLFFIMILFATVQRATSDVPKANLGYNIQRKLEGAGYISIKFNQNVNYAGDLKESQFKQEITQLVYEGKAHLISETFEINADVSLDIYFTHPIKSLEKFFDITNGYSWLSRIFWADFSNFDSSSLENIQSLFYGCNSLQEVNFANFNTSFIINMANMFYGCSSLKITEFITFLHTIT